MLMFISNYTKKFAKGMFGLLVLNCIILFSVMLFESCKKNESSVEKNDFALKKFLSAVKTETAAIGGQHLDGDNAQNGSQSKIAVNADVIYGAAESIYIDFPQPIGYETYTLFQNTNTIQELTDLINVTDATIQYSPTPTNSAYEINVDLQPIMNSLNPLVNEAKQYLYSKGLTENDIQEMVISEGGKQEDLIPFVLCLAHYENTQLLSKNNYPEIFINSAYAVIDAEDYKRCALAAIGIDLMYAVQTSNITSWSLPVVKKAFGVVAKRALGPIGVAAAVISFGYCMYEAE